MLNHIVFFKARPEASITEVKAAVRRLHELVGVVMEMKTFWLSTSPTQDSGWDACLKIEFESEEEMERYSIHPLHAAIAKEINAVATVAIFDGWED